MNRSARILLILAALGGLIICAPLLFPYARCIPELERQLGQKLHGKVSIGKIGFNYLPRPTFTIEQVRFERQESATISRISIPLSAHTLLKAGKEIDEARAEDISLTPRIALGLASSFAPNKNQQIQLRKLALNNVTVALNKESIGPLDAQLNFKPDGSIDHLALQSAGGNATLQILPTGADSFQLGFNARQWQLPSAYPVKFDSLQLVGHASPNSLRIPEIHATLYGGIVTGSARLDWLDTLTLTGKINARSIKAEPLINVFSPNTHISGLLAGEGAFLYRAPLLKTLFDAPRLQGSFIINEGTLHQLDLVAPLRSSASGQPFSGGQTNFNQFSGNINVQGTNVSLHNMKLEAGKFRAQGHAGIRDGKLSGNITATIASGGILATSPLGLGGTLSAPFLQSGDPWRPDQPENSGQ